MTVEQNLTRTLRDDLNNQFHLFGTFSSIFADTNFYPTNNRILDIGCGDSCTGEYLMLSMLYAGRYQMSPHFTFIDVDKQRFNYARQVINCENSSTFISSNFIEGDGRKLDELVSGNFGLVVVRHPEVENSYTSAKHDILFDVWREIFAKITAVLSPNGLLVVTHANLPGFNYCVEAMNHHYEIIGCSGLNSNHGFTLNYLHQETCKYDKYVVVARS